MPLLGILAFDVQWLEAKELTRFSAPARLDDDRFSKRVRRRTVFASTGTN
jgi:hypothetical protein